MSLPKEIFREYDIRGTYPDQINEKGLEVLGKALGTLFLERKYKTVAVGRDDRESAASLTQHLISGILSSGINVVYAGITVEPAIHYFTFLDNIDAAINVTASHNPGKYNGIKIDYKNAVPFYGQHLTYLYTFMKSKNFISGQGKYTEENLNAKYIDFISSKFKLKKPLKVVVYCGNGATSEIYPAVLSKIGAEVIPLRCYFDSDFPVGIPDPESGNFYPELRQQVLESRADVGVGFDGDGDRVGEVDAIGDHYGADEILKLYIKEVLTKNKGATVVYDVKCSQTVEDYIRKMGGIPKMLKTGRAYFLDEMFSGRALLGAELSGHTFFKDEFPGFDDGVYAACRLLRIMDESGRSLNELMQEFPKMYATPEIKVPCEDEKKFEIITKLKKSVESSKQFIDVNYTDGIRAKVTPTGWFLIRASNTSPYLSMRVEGKDKIEVDRILEITAKLLTNEGLQLADAKG